MILKSSAPHSQDEYAASGQALVMHRRVDCVLRAALAARSPGHILLDGMPGSGKSVALASLAHWARASGWVVRVPLLILPQELLCCSSSMHIRDGGDVLCISKGGLGRECFVVQVAVENTEAGCCVSLF